MAVVSTGAEREAQVLPKRTRLVPAKLSKSEPHLWLATIEKAHAPTTTLIYEGVLSTLLTPSVVVQIA